MTVYTVTDWLGLVPIFICGFFGFVGLIRLIKRKSLFKVDADIIGSVLIVKGFLMIKNGSKL